jgi:hypothetical protein
MTYLMCEMGWGRYPLASRGPGNSGTGENWLHPDPSRF